MTEQTVSYDAIKGAPISLFMLCASVEQELSKACLALGQASPPQGMGALTQAWLDLHVGRGGAEHTEILDRIDQRLREAIALRNHLAHGILGWSAAPHGPPEAAVIHTCLNGVERRFSWPDLLQAMLRLDRLRDAIPTMTHALLKPERAADAYQGLRINSLPDL